MVPVSASLPASVISDIYTSLSGKIKAIDPNSLEGIFAAWMCEEVPPPEANGLLANFSTMNYREVAKLALWIELTPEKITEYNNQLEEGLRRAAGRTETLLDEPAPYCNDVLALLALAIGAKRLGGDVLIQVSNWMGKFINLNNEILPPWKRLFLFITLRLLGQCIDQYPLKGLNNLSDLELAFATKVGDFSMEIDLDSAYRAVTTSSICEQLEPEILSCKLAAFNYLITKLPAISIGKPNLEQVTALLNNIPSGFKRWPWEEKAKTSTGIAQKWDIQNEYHVQSLLYFLLAPIFQDIEQEFYLEQLGPLNSRADIGLPSLNLIIEIKFLRTGTSFTNMIEQVAADASLYFKKDSVYTKKYNKMLVLLWDNSARIQEHHEFKKAVSQLSNIDAAVVISRPGNMPIQKKESSNEGNE
jgi:REase_DpnII-MboI